MILLRPVLIDFGPYVGALVLFALAWAWPATIGALLDAIARMLHGIPVVGSRVASRVRDANQYVLHKIGDLEIAVEAPIVRFFIGLAHVVTIGSYTVSNGAVATLRAFEELTTVTIPRFSRASIGKLALASVAAWKALLWLQRHLHAVQAVTRYGAVTLPREIARDVRMPLRVIERAVAVELPHALGGIRAEVKEWVGYTQRNIARRLRRLEGLLATAIFSGLVLRALARHLPWYRCTNVNRFARQLCRSPFHFVDDLLTLFADFFVLTNICHVIPWLERGFEDVATPLISTLARVGAGVCDSGYARGPDLGVPELHLPNVQTGPLHLV